MKIFMENESLSKLLVSELRQALQYWNLSKDGKKDELCQRLNFYLSNVAVLSQSVPQTLNVCFFV